MLPVKGNLLVLSLVVFCVAVNGLPFNAKYRFARDTAEELIPEEEGSGSGNLYERDAIAQNASVLAAPVPGGHANATKEGAKDSKAASEKAEAKEEPKEKATKEQSKSFDDGQSLTSSEFANKPAADNKDVKEAPKVEEKKAQSKSDINENQAEDEVSEQQESPAEETSEEQPAQEGESEEEPSEEDGGNEEQQDNEENQEDSNEEDSGNNEEEKKKDQVASNLKMFFISPYQKNGEEDPSTRQILTYPAKSQGWGNTHQFGPSHIWNSDYPYFAYGYSWGCGHHGYGGIGHAKKSGVAKEEDAQCRDYVLIPAAPQASAVLSPAENGVARNFVNKDIACNDGDTECTQRQVIGSMAGGSMFGDGMGGLGLGFPGVPGLHTGISGYNMAGGFGDHMGNGHGGHHGGHRGAHGGGAGGGYAGGYGAHFFKAEEHGIPSYWNARADIPKGDVKGFFGGRGAAFFHGEDILPIHEAANGIGSGSSYGVGSAQYWDKTPNFGAIHSGFFGGRGGFGGYGGVGYGGRGGFGGYGGRGYGLGGWDSSGWWWMVSWRR
uniref:Cnidarian restricted protein n=1 Tax=Clytia hemisphaerica TaxID=252671 RepID=A0A7M5WSG3_9CNID